MDEVRFLIAVLSKNSDSWNLIENSNSHNQLRIIENVENLKMSNDHNKETDMQACELAESWGNGNISHVLLALKAMPKGNAIVMALKLTCDFNSGEVIRFMRAVEQSFDVEQSFYWG